MSRSTSSIIASRLAATWLVAFVACLPILALLLIPQLMRSRAGSEQLLGIGTALLLVLVTGAVVIAPVLSARAVTLAGSWTTATALRTTREIWSTRRRASILALCGLLGLYGIAQRGGLGIGGVLTYAEMGKSWG